MSLPNLIIILGVAMLLLAIAFIVIIFIKRKNENKTSLFVLSRITLVLLILVSISTISCIVLAKEANDRGMYDNSQPINEIIEHVINSPIDQSTEIPAEPKNMIVLVYRFDCPDCNALHNQIEQDLSNVNHINVSSRTPEGKMFSTEYGVNQVPSAVAFSSTGEHLTLPLYTSDENENPIYLPENMEALIAFAAL